MEREISIIQLANAVQWWMSYTSAVGRSYVLAESSIRFPLAEYLERSSLKNIKLEYNHPKLSSRRFDIHFEDNKNNETAIEFKFIKNGSTRDTSEKKRVFNDLMRLYLYLDSNKKGYFLICGAQQDFSQDFFRLLPKPPNATEKNPYINPENEVNRSLKALPEGFYSKWFSFNKLDPDRNIFPIIDNDEYGKIYQAFLDEYKLIYKETTQEELSFPDKFKTRLLYLSQEIEHDDEFYQPATIGIWEVIKE